MFERFTQAARETVVGAQVEARHLHQGVIGTEHLLLALLARPDTLAGSVLLRHGLTHDGVARAVAALLHRDDFDADALGSLGIDLDAVRTSAEAAFGPGALDRGGPTRDAHLPFSRRAKKVLELSLREAIALKSRSIGDVHIALGLLREGEGLALQVLTEGGVDPAQLRQDLTTALAA